MKITSLKTNFVSSSSFFFFFILKSVKINASVALHSLYPSILRKLGFNTVKAYEKKHRVILSFLGKIFADILDKYKDEPIYRNEDTVKNDLDGSIWVFWDDATNIPPIVERCLFQIRKYAGNRKVICINRENVTKYVNLPTVIAEKYKKGFISRTHFCDIIRTAIMLKYGGIYMDVTIVQIAPMPKYVEIGDFFTFRNFKLDKPYEVISHGNWTVFCFACKKNNLLMRMTYEMMIRYWERYDFLFDYLWMDYFWMLCIEKIPIIKKMFNQVPCTNPHVLNLLRYPLDKETTKEKYLQMFSEDTIFYKLGYKATVGIPTKTSDGELTLLGRIIEIDL